MSAASPRQTLDWRAFGSLAELLAARTDRSPQAIAYLEHGAGRWQPYRWAQVLARAGRFQAALRAEGLEPGARVAVMLPNSVDWVCMDQAALAQGLLVVPVYTADRPENARYVLEHSAARLLLTSAATWQALRAAGVPDTLTRVVLTDPADADADPRVRVLTRWLPAQGSFAPLPVPADGGAAIVYTSGTTGRPKGVVLSHRAVLWNAGAALARVPVQGEERLLSFLPLSHTLERTCGYYLPMLAGSQVAFARGVAELPADLRAVRPTLVVSVPRIFERAQRALEETHARWPGWLARTHRALLGLGARHAAYVQGHAPRPRGWSVLAPLVRLAGAPLRARFGGRLRRAISGGAPLRVATAELFAACGMPIVQGYGLTETAPVLTANPPQDNRLGTVGPALEGVELRCADNGELLARTPGLMQGYWQDADATARAVDAQGWLHTGDLATQEDGYWTLIGRLKDLLVLATGEKVPTADLELALTGDPLIAQALVLGEGKPYLAALLVLEPTAWRALAAALGLAQDAPASLADPRAMEALLARVDGALYAFPGYARVRRVHLSLEPWTVDNELLTSTLKPRRARIVERYADVVAGLYAGH